MTRRCDRPLDLPTLSSYWLAELPGPETERVEEHLFACDECGAQLRALLALAEGVRRLAHEGAIQMVVAPSFLETAARAGLRIREYAVPPGGSVECTVTPQDDLLIGRMGADFRGTSRVDVLVEVQGQPAGTIEDVPVSPDARELILAQSMPAARALGSVALRFRLVALEGPGERVLGEYTFNHTPTAS